jgi:hypothetical protein
MEVCKLCSGSDGINYVSVGDPMAILLTGPSKPPLISPTT